VEGEVAAIKPVLRGWSHAVATVPALAGAVALAVAAQQRHALQLSLLVYGVALVLLFGVSATYHVPPWSARWKERWRRFDHASIFVMIAGTYTAIASNILDGWLRVVILTVIWTLASVGIVVCASPLRLPRPALALMYVSTGWVAVVAMPALIARLSATGLIFLVTGGVLYSAGAIVYTLRRPVLWPRVFGYHELFHLIVIAATALFFAFIAADIVAVQRG